MTKVHENPENGTLDFTLDVPEGRDIKLLQLTDIQTIKLEGVRKTENNSRYGQVSGAFFSDEASHDDYIRAWRYVEEAVETSNPDLILLTGDNIYGQTDDSGEQWLKLCEVLDSFGIPWAVIFGNHDNESGKGVLWQIEQVRNTKYGIIKQGDVTGNSNYTIGIRQSGQYKYILYMIDSNGCRIYTNPGEGMNPDNIDIDRIQQAEGVHPDQLEWMRSSYTAISEICGYTVPTMICMHIPSVESRYAVDTLYPEAYSSDSFIPNREGDFGVSYEKAGCFNDGGKFWNTAKEIGCTGLFVGHQHKIATSIVYDGIRITYGMKTGTFDYFHENALGSTLITIKESDNSYEVKYLRSQLEYVKVPKPN